MYRPTSTLSLGELTVAVDLPNHFMGLGAVDDLSTVSVPEPYTIAEEFEEATNIDFNFMFGLSLLSGAAFGIRGYFLTERTTQRLGWFVGGILAPWVGIGTAYAIKKMAR